MKDLYDTKMIWAACRLCYLAFLRAGEMTVPADNDYDLTVHLRVLRTLLWITRSIRQFSG